MVAGAFPDLAANLVYTVLCLVPGFVSMKTVAHVTGVDVGADSFDKSAWCLIGSGAALSLLYFLYVGATGLATGRFALIVPLDLQWTELVAAYPVLLTVAVLLGYVAAWAYGRVFEAGVTADAGTGLQAE